jgi:hypothetical protein
VRGDDADCNGRANEGCECIPGSGNASCSADPNNSRCGPQGTCAPCQVNADCSLVSGGRVLCSSGRCVECATNGDCPGGRVCANSVCRVAPGGACAVRSDCSGGNCSSWFHEARPLKQLPSHAATAEQAACRQLFAQSRRPRCHQPGQVSPPRTPVTQRAHPAPL